VTLEQGLVFVVISLTLVMLAFEVWRYDLVALVGMLLLILFGIISVDDAFAGFGHPAVVTIAAVLVVSRGLQNTGVTDVVARWMCTVGDQLALQLAILCGLVIVTSAFMNNIAALAIFIPVAVRLARRSARPSSFYLLPMAFSSHFGGLITLIGTPTNLIVSALRYNQTGEPFGMFAFAPVGLAISVVGVLFIVLVGWRLIPRRKAASDIQNDAGMADYLSEIVVPSESKLVGLRLRDLPSVTDANIWVVAILRTDERVPSPTGSMRLHADDILLVRAGANDLQQFIYDTGVELAETKPIDGGEQKPQPDAEASMWEALKARIQADDIDTVEVVVSPESLMLNKTARDLDLRARYGVNLLAISRCREHLADAIGATPVKPADVLLLQGRHKHLAEILQELGCLPLAERELHLVPKNMILGMGIFGTALLAATLDLLPVPTAVMAAAVAMVLAGVLTAREAYASVQWPIIVLLGAMLSMGAALQQTGGDQLIANQILRSAGLLSPTVLLVLLMLVTMTLSDIVNNAAAVVLMGTIAINVARGLGVSLDPFLVAVALGGACAFLTPVGHEANVLVFEIGGYEFGDYWKLGLPLELLITAVAVPLLLLIWPL
jgi:di/tricarboxylate transporter